MYFNIFKISELDYFFNKGPTFDVFNLFTIRLRLYKNVLDIKNLAIHSSKDCHDFMFAKVISYRLGLVYFCFGYLNCEINIMLNNFLR